MAPNQECRWTKSTLFIHWTLNGNEDVVGSSARNSRVEKEEERRGLMQGEDLRITEELVLDEIVSALAAAVEVLHGKGSETIDQSLLRRK
jgi:F420-0:gamma-glutamyl ligase